MMLDITPLAIPDVLQLRPKKFGDDRGFFAETFNQEQLEAAGVALSWIQDNQSLSTARFTLRGLHYQRPPFAQDKLVRVLKGAILDLAVDIRENSPSFGRWVALEVSAERFNQILIPKGFAHGFLTLLPDTEVFYKVSARYSADHAHTLRWDDPDIAIDWSLEGQQPVLSARDKAAPFLRDLPNALSCGKSG